MGERQTVKLTKRTVDAAQPRDKRFRIYDAQLPAFGLRVMPSGIKSYFVQYRPAGGGRDVDPVEYTIGKHGDDLTPDQARNLAKDVLRDVRNGLDPQKEKLIKRTEPTVADLWALYRAEGCEHKKASTLGTDASRYKSHILPLLGSKRLSTIDKADVDKFLKDVASGKTAATATRAGKGQTRKAPRALGGKGTATRTVGLLGGMFTFAMGHKTTKAFVKVHPVFGVKRYKDNKWQRYLNAEELGRLGEVIRESLENQKATRVILLLALTGARKSEIEGLKRKEFIAHLSHLQLGDSKTGYKFIPLGAEAVEILQSIDVTEPSEYLFPATSKPGGHFVGTYRIWRRIREKAGLADVRLHDLRHTFASTGIHSSGNLSLVGKILGHSDIKTTMQYAHLADIPVRQAAEETSRLTAHALAGGGKVPLTDSQLDTVRRMLSVDIGIDVIARAIGVSVDQVASVIKDRET